MKKWLLRIKATLLLTACSQGFAQDFDVFSIKPDLPLPPSLTSGRPAPGKFVKQFLPEYQGTEIYHGLYLPTDWVQGKKYPVISEYAGNTISPSPDSAHGRVEGCKLGYGITAGTNCIWVCLPYIQPDHKTYAKTWWGDVEATVKYCKDVVPKICREYGGDTNALFIAGFSRGAIACNFIGLHDDEIASLWRGFICHSHYDGVYESWPYEGKDRVSATTRLSRLGNRPQFISHEISDKISLEQTKQFLQNACPKGDFTFAQLPFTNHTDRWVYRDIRQREILRAWFRRVSKSAADNKN